MKILRIFVYFVIFIIGFDIQSGFSKAHAQNAIEKVAKQELEAVLTTELILNNSQAVTLGTLNFDPSEIFGSLGDQFGTEQSISRRRGITTFNLPGRIPLGVSSAGNDSNNAEPQHHVKVGLSFLELKQDLTTGSNEEPEDNYKSRVLALYGKYQYATQWATHWRMKVEAGLHWQRYENRYAYENTTSQAISGDIDGVLFNNTADAAVASTGLSVSYRRQDVKIPWQWQTRYTYWKGATFDEADQQPSAHPEAWLLSNGVILKQPLPDVWERNNRLQYSVKRFDLGGDATRVLLANYYYQLSVGWLVKAAKDNSWFKNYGVSLGMNIGSALRGGTVQINYNNDF